MIELSPYTTELLQIGILSLALVFVCMLLAHGLSRVVDKLIERTFTE